MWVGGQHHPPAALPPGRTRYPLYRVLGGPQGRSGRGRKISLPPGFDPRTFQFRSESLYRLSYRGPPPVLTVSSNSRTLTPSSAKLTTASRCRTMRTSTTGAMWPNRDIRGNLVTTGFHSLTTRSLLPVASRCNERSRWKQRTP